MTQTASLKSYTQIFGQQSQTKFVLKIRLSKELCAPTLKKILERKDQYLYVARRTFTNLFLGVNCLNLLRAVPDLTQLSHENIYL